MNLYNNFILCAKCFTYLAYTLEFLVNKALHLILKIFAV